jgi:hypothetical protein
MKSIGLLLLAALLPLSASAATVQLGGGYQLVYSAFNTTFLEPEIAARYGLSRGRDRGLVNIAVIDSDNRPQPAQLSGRVSNILQQQQSLNFITIDEGAAIYYLAPFKIDGEEFLSFHISVVSAGLPSKTFNFKQRLYEQ